MFRATYKPEYYNAAGDFAGYAEDSAETVLVIAVNSPRRGIIPEAIFISSQGNLGIAPFDCFSDCIVLRNET